jgi:hypothetical protein
VDLKLSDDCFKKRKKNVSPNGEKMSMEKFEFEQKWFFAVLAFLVLFFGEFLSFWP